MNLVGSAFVTGRHGGLGVVFDIGHLALGICGTVGRCIMFYVYP